MKVVIVAGDMRKWKAPEKVGGGVYFFFFFQFFMYTYVLLLALLLGYIDARIQADILVSELLGSWGDNELSPVSFVWVVSIIVICVSYAK